MLLTRRSFFGGAASLLAAPAIVRASSLMPVKAWDLDAIAIHDQSGRLWSLPDGLKIREYGLGGFGFSVPPGNAPLYAVHRSTGRAILLRDRLANARIVGWVPIADTAANIREGGLSTSTQWMSGPAYSRAVKAA